MFGVDMRKADLKSEQNEASGRGARPQNIYSSANTLTADTDDQKFNCDNADGHSQTNNRKKMSGSWIRKTSRDFVWTQGVGIVLLFRDLL